MKSHDKLEVKAMPMLEYCGKLWVHVKLLFGGNNWIPSFEDLYRIMQAICFCEDKKYPPRPDGLVGPEGRGFVMRFILDACKEGMTWEELRKKYKIPER